MELYVFYDTVANTNCQSESSKKFHKHSERIPKLCRAAVNISKESSFLQECFVFMAERWYTEFCALVRAVRFVYMGFRRGGSQDGSPCI
jgi:hypothetical protein